MPNTRKIPRNLDLAERASFYNVCERSVRRWHNAGADLADPCSVAMHLASQKSPSPAAVAAVRRLLKTELNNLNS
jgi:hypothetical protein